MSSPACTSPCSPAGLFWFLRRLRLPQGLAVLITILVAFAYAELTGFGIPAQRALIMTAIYLVARWLDREITALNALGAAALAVLVLDPRALFEASFQMTFIVILAIAGLAIPLSERLILPRLRALRHLDIVRADAALPPRIAQFRVHTRMLTELSADLFSPRLAQPSRLAPPRSSSGPAKPSSSPLPPSSA